MRPDELDFIRSDFAAYCQYIFEAQRGIPFVWNSHFQILCDAMERVYAGDVKRLIITIPPRFGKTQVVVVNFASWAIGLNPDSEFIHCSYSATLAANNSYQIREMVQHEAYTELFPEFSLAGDSKARHWWRTAQGGAFYATGAEGTITGFGAGKVGRGNGDFAGCVLIDDIHKAKEAKRSEASRQSVIDFFQTTLESRLNDQNTPIVVVGQRLHENDLTGWLLNGGNGKEWELIELPAMSEDGVPLWPAKMDKAELQRLEKTKPYEYASQYQQRPVPLGGGMFKEAWLNHRYRQAPRFSMIVQSWDTAQKDKIDRNDPAVCTTWGLAADGYYLLDVLRKHMEYPDLEQSAKDQAAKWRPSAILIEDKSSGISLIQSLKRSSRLPVIAYDPKGLSKIDRADTVTGFYESGRVKLPESAEWVAGYVSELTRFPLGAHDDQVDSSSQFLNWINEKATGGGFATAGKRRT